MGIIIIFQNSTILWRKKGREVCERVQGWRDEVQIEAEGRSKARGMMMVRFF